MIMVKYLLFFTLNFSRNFNRCYYFDRHLLNFVFWTKHFEVKRLVTQCYALGRRRKVDEWVMGTDDETVGREWVEGFSNVTKGSYDSLNVKGYTSFEKGRVTETYTTRVVKITGKVKHLILSAMCRIFLT